MKLNRPRLDPKRFGDDLLRLHGATSSESLFQAMLEILASHVGSETQNFNDIEWVDHAPSELEAGELHELPNRHYELQARRPTFRAMVVAHPIRTDLRFDEVFSAFERNVESHPTIVACRKRRGLHVYRLSDLTTERKFVQTPLYAEFFRHFSVRKQIIAYLDYGRRREVVVAVGRGRGRDFSDADREVVRWLSPHFRQALLNLRSRLSIQEQLGQARRLLERFEMPCLCLDPAGVVQWMSPRAEALLMEFFGRERPTRTRLPGAVQAWVERHPLVSRDPRTPPGCARPMVSVTDGARLELHLECGASGELLILLKRESTVLSAEGFAFPGLTRRQNEVLFWLAHGRTNDAIATLVGARPRTVNKHIQSLFSRMGVANRSEAIVLARGFMEGRG